MPHLVEKVSDGSSVIHELNDPLITIGRHPDNTIVLDDLSISSHHAQIRLEGDAYRLHDLNSSNGTEVNGNRVQDVELKNGEVVRFGAVECIFKNAPTVKPAEDQPEEEHATFGSKLASLGKAAWHETQRNARLAALKARIEKIKHFDLSQAYYALGKKAYELKINRETLGVNYQEMFSLEEEIKLKRSGVASGEGSTRMDKIKDAAITVKKKVEAEALKHRLKGQLTQLGQELEGTSDLPDLQTELNDVISLKCEMNNLEGDYAAVASGQESFSALKWEKGSPSASKSFFSRRVTLRMFLYTCAIVTVLFWFSYLGLNRYFDQKRAHVVMVEFDKEQKDAAAQKMQTELSYAADAVRRARAAVQDKGKALDNERMTTTMSGVENLGERRQAAAAFVQAEQNLDDALKQYKSLGGTGDP